MLIRYKSIQVLFWTHECTFRFDTITHCIVIYFGFYLFVIMSDVDNDNNHFRDCVQFLCRAKNGTKKCNYKIDLHYCVENENWIEVIWKGFQGPSKNMCTWWNKCYGASANHLNHEILLALANITWHLISGIRTLCISHFTMNK